MHFDPDSEQEWDFNPDESIKTEEVSNHSAEEPSPPPEITDNAIFPEDTVPQQSADLPMELRDFLAPTDTDFDGRMDSLEASPAEDGQPPITQDTEDGDISKNDTEPLEEMSLPSEEKPTNHDDEIPFWEPEYRFEEGTSAEEIPEPTKKRKTRAVKKGRPRRKSKEGLFGIPNILVTIVWCGLTLLISLTLGRMVWVCAAEVLAFGREDRTVTVTIYENDTIDTITTKLAREGLIRYPELFKLYAKFAVDDGDIRPGMWDLNTKYDYHALVNMMSPSSSRDVVKVMIPEGYTCRQIFALLEENKVCTSKDIAAYAESGELGDYWFLDGVIRDNKYCLEGFLFPDTYEFYQNDSPKSVLTKILNNFDKRFDEGMRAQIQTLNNTLADLMRRDGRGQDYINANLFTVRDVVNVASMIEKETSSAEEGHTIASVIYNRLFYWHGNPPYLNIDATIIYALDGKTDLTTEDLRVDSPYNTYTHTGLTPGPISNPGLTSLQAALTPANTQYYFYVLNPTTGSHVFATTQAEHDANRAQFGG